MLSKPYYLFRGQLIGDIRQEGEMTVGTILVSKEELKAMTYNFKKYAKEIDVADEKHADTIEDMPTMYEFVNTLKGKYR